MQRAGDWKHGFGRRLGYFALGLGIGLVLLGIIKQARQQATAPQQTKQPAPNPTSAPTPAR